MLTENDLGRLRGLSEPAHRFALVALILMATFHVYSVYHNFSLALDYAQALGLDFSATLQMWNSEPELAKMYSGYEQQSLHRLNMAIIQFGMAILFGVWAVSLVLGRAHNKRVLAELKSAGLVGSALSHGPAARMTGGEDA